MDALDDTPVDVLGPAPSNLRVSERLQRKRKTTVNDVPMDAPTDDISTIVGDHRQLRRQTEDTNDRFIRNKTVNESCTVSSRGFLASKVPKTRLEAALEPRVTRGKAHHSPRRSMRIQSFNSSNVAVVNHEIRKDDDSISLIKSR